VNTLKLSCCTVDLLRHRVEGAEGFAPLTGMEVRLLSYFAGRVGDLIRKEELLKHVWDYRGNSSTNTVRTTVNRVRAKIEENPRKPVHLLTEFGRGYRFLMPGIEAGLESGPLVLPEGRVFGREQALHEISLKFAEHRLVVVTGAAGVGKSTLCAAYADHHIKREGLGIVDLSRATSAHDLVALTARSLGLDRAGEVGRALRAHGEALLVLDGVEAVAPAAGPVIEDWLGGAPGLRVLVGSQIALRTQSEVVVQLRPLSSEDAIAMLRDRAAVAGIPTLTGPVEDVVEVLDRLPLALALAAGWLGTLSVADILERVSVDRFSLLGADRSSLRQTLDRSWALLGEDERDVLGQLAVFKGGFTMAAAEAVVVTGAWTPGVIRDLHRRSLIQRTHSEAVRLRMLGAVRDFVASVSEASPELIDRHRHWCVERAAVLQRDAEGPDGGEARAEQLREQLNFEEALSKALPKYPVYAGKLALALAPTLARHGAVNRSRAQLAASALALAQPDQQTLKVLVEIAGIASRVMRGEKLEGSRKQLVDLCVLADASGDIEARVEVRMTLGIAQVYSGIPADEVFGEALAISREGDDERLVGRALRMVGTAQRNRGGLQEAMGTLQQARAVLERIGAQRHLVLTLIDLALALQMAGRDEDSFDTAERALGLAVAQDLPGPAGICHHRMGEVRHSQLRHPEAREHFGHALQVQRELGHRRDAAIASWALGCVALSGADHKRCRDHLEEALAEARNLEDPRFQASILTSLGMMWLDRARPSEAIVRFEEAYALHLPMGEPHYIKSSRLGLALTALWQARPEVARQHLDAIAADGDSSKILSACRSALAAADADADVANDAVGRIEAEDVPHYRALAWVARGFASLASRDRAGATAALEGARDEEGTWTHNENVRILGGILSRMITS